MNRREFLTAGAAAAAASMMGGYVAYAADQKTYRVGLIGTGWYGKSDLFRLIQVSPVEVVSLCDPDKHMLSEAAEMVAGRQRSKKTPRTYGDYRDMLKEKDLDIVLIGSPDHWHSLQMIAAVESGADVYVQKPISRDVLEGEAMVAAARKNNRVVQVGTQRKSTPHLVEAKREIVDTGMLGKVGQVDLCCYFHMRANGDPPPAPSLIISTMKCGPAPRRCEIRHPPPQALVAHLHAIWQRHRRRHVRPHVRHRPMDAEPRLAQARFLLRRHLRANRRQVEHHRHPDRHLRIR